MVNNSSPLRAPKTGAQLRDNPEEREKWRKTEKTPLHRRHKTRLLKAECLSLLRAGMSTNSGDHVHPHDHRDVTTLLNCATGTCGSQRACQRPCPELHRLQLWEFGCLLHTCTQELDRHNKVIDHLVNVQQLENLWRTRGICICATTGMSTTWSKNSTTCNCGISTVSSQLQTNLLDLHNKHRSPCQCTAGESLWFSGGPWESASAPRQRCRRHAQLECPQTAR